MKPPEPHPHPSPLAPNLDHAFTKSKFKAAAAAVRTSSNLDKLEILIAQMTGCEDAIVKAIEGMPEAWKLTRIDYLLTSMHTTRVVVALKSFKECYEESYPEFHVSQKIDPPELASPYQVTGYTEYAIHVIVEIEKQLRSKLKNAGFPGSPNFEINYKRYTTVETSIQEVKAALNTLIVGLKHPEHRLDIGEEERAAKKKLKEKE